MIERTGIGYFLLFVALAALLIYGAGGCITVPTGTAYPAGDGVLTDTNGAPVDVFYLDCEFLP